MSTCICGGPSVLIHRPPGSIHRGTQSEAPTLCDAQVQTTTLDFAEACRAGSCKIERPNGQHEGSARGKGKAVDTASWVGDEDCCTEVDGSGTPMDLDDDLVYMDVDDDVVYMDVD